jgi:plasmid stabilization system protein ParE
MTSVLVLIPEAEHDIRQAQDWYDRQSPGVGADFVEAVGALLDVIRNEPLLYQRFWRNYRRAGVRRFPYGLIYTVSHIEITVLACTHGRRHPRTWRKRITP